MSAVDGSVFEVYQGGVQAAGLGVGGVVADGGVPADGDGLAGEHERDRALDLAGGAVAGLAGAERLLRVLDRDFTADHLAAYLSITAATSGFFSVVTRARSKPVFDLSRMRMTVTGAVPVTEYHRQVSARTAMVSVLP